MLFRCFLAGLLGVFLVGSAEAAGQKRGLEITWIDTEGGAATLIVTPAGESVLIDCGNPGTRDAERIHQAAKKAGLTAIDHLIITHWHSDHYGSAEKLASHLPIRHFYDRGIPATLDEDRANFPSLIRAYKAAGGNKSTTLKAGDEVKLKQVAGSPAIKLLCICGNGAVIAEPAGARDNPLAREHKAKPTDSSDNAKSLGFLLSVGGWRFLDVGDLTWNVEASLVAPRDRIGEVDVFQVTHHGLDISNNPVLVRTVNPRVAICNNGPRKGGHPVVLATLRRLPDMQGLFQMHRNLGSKDSENTSADRIANDGKKKESGSTIRLVLEPDASAYSVIVDRSGKTFRFRTRAADAKK